MPGRLAIYDDQQFKTDAKTLINNDMVGTLTPSYNIAPTLPIPVLLNNGNYIPSHFGYLSSWAKSKSSMNINARSESIFEKKTFRDSFRSRRCLIPLNGFFEWEVEDKTKKPYFVKDMNRDYLAVAGIWDEWFDETLGMSYVTVALITCDANEKLAKIHHRMPVVIEPKDFKTWLHSPDLKSVNALFNIYESSKLDLYEVASQVNKVENNNQKNISKKTINKELTLF